MNSVSKAVSSWAGVLRVALALSLVACVGQPPPETHWTDDGGLIGADSGVSDVDSSTPPGHPDASPPDAEVPPEEISAERMYADVAVLASDEYAGRKPGTEGNELAMQYVENLFAEYGLEPLGDNGTYRHGFSYYNAVPTSSPALSIGGIAVAEGSGFELVSGSGSGEVAAEIAFVGYGLTVPGYSSAAYPDCPLDPSGYDDYAGLDVSGKVVLVLRRGFESRAPLHRVCPANAAARGPDALWDFGYKAANARLHGAAGMLLVAESDEGPDMFRADLTRSYYAPDFPALVLSRSVAAGHLPQIRKWARRIDTTMTPRSAVTGVTASLATSTAMTYGQTSNIVGAIIGSDPSLADEVILIGGHLDHLGTGSSGIYNGADDNASGTAVTMELARMAARGGLVPKRTLIFAGFNAEEMGLIGSCDMAEDFMYPLDDVVLMLSVDMVGAGSGSGISLIGGRESKNTWFGDLVRSGAGVDGLDFDVSESWYSGASDHACFHNRGVSAMLVMSRGSHDYYHTTSDTIGNIQQENLDVTARMIWAALRPLAMGEEDLHYSAAGTGRRPAGAVEREAEARSLLR